MGIIFAPEDYPRGFPFTDGTTEEHFADFSPSVSDWQYASVQFSKEKYKAVNNITVYCDYNYQSGSAYFDALELTRDYIETGLSSADFDGNDSSTEGDTSYDVEIDEAKDAFGNIITETTHTNAFSEGVIYRSFEYDESGNNLVKETDPRGNATTYVVDEETSRNTTVIDRCGNRTSYSYDGAGRVNSIMTSDSDNFLLSRVAYSYDPLDNITEISRNDGQKYTLAYDSYRNLESIGIDGRDSKLITYTRRSNNGRVKKIAYANGDYMKASYNNMGYMISEKWYDSNDTLKYEYIYSYDNEGNIVKTIDNGNLREYNYLYDEGNIVRSTEYDISGGTKTRLATIFYVYNEAGELVRKRIVPAEGNEQVYQLTNADNESEATLTSLDASYIAKTTTDNLGRKITDTLGDLTKSYTYYSGEATEEHNANGLNFGYATTQLVKKITYSDGRELQYVYDNEERITAVGDSLDQSVTVYTYDALGQLTSEVKNDVTVNTMTYDDYGNIKSKNGKTYTYGNSYWKDLLTSYNGSSITYDEQGNPTNYMGTALVWEKGRQLKSFGTTTYKYNANGVRICKSVGTTEHHYILDGTKILKETWGTNTIIPLYDNEESVCGIVYNGTVYYFVKNLQGDVISITNPSGTTLARYSYDAWGKCTITEDTTTVGIATVNPYRYRSYYYDSETRLYYLQSRYYDPETGRFLNADEAGMAVRKSVAMRSNLFAYCFNSVTNSIDPLGLDAIWLQATKSVFGLGHTGLIFQHKNKWYYWYWGADFEITSHDALEAIVISTSISNSLIVGKSLAVFISAVITKYMLEELKVKKDLNKNSAKKEANKLYTSGKFDKSFYIRGNFDKAYSYYKGLTVKKNYDLLKNNCMQTTVTGLCRGKFKSNNFLNKIRMNIAKSMTIPNLAYNYLKNFF